MTVGRCQVCGIPTLEALCLGCADAAQRRADEIRVPLRKVRRGKREPKPKPVPPPIRSYVGPTGPLPATERARHCGVVLDHSRDHVMYGDPGRERFTLTIIEFDGSERTFPWCRP